MGNQGRERSNKVHRSTMPLLSKDGGKTWRKNLELARCTAFSCLHESTILHSGNNLKVAFVKLFARLSNFRSFLKDILVFNTRIQIECKSRVTSESKSAIANSAYNV